MLNTAMVLFRCRVYAVICFFALLCAICAAPVGDEDTPSLVNSEDENNVKQSEDEKVTTTTTIAPSASPVSDLPMTQQVSDWVSDNEPMLMRALYVLFGLGLLLVLYFVVKYAVIRRRKSRPSRRYNMLDSQRLNAALVVDTSEDDDEDDIYDAQKLVQTEDGPSINGYGSPAKHAPGSQLKNIAID